MSGAGASDRDTILLARLRNDDERALDELLEAHFDDVASLAFHYVHTRDIAREIAQDAFIRLWEHRHTFEPRADVIHFLRRVAYRRALEVLRHTSRVTRLETRVADESALLMAHAANDGAAAVQRDEFDQKVRRVAAALSPRVREVFFLYYERGFEPGEIALFLDVAPRTIYNQLRTAMQHFTREFAGWRE
jgi:RNA polymerase sigma-70 factor (ECF subfamily)